MDVSVSIFVNRHLRETKQIRTPCTVGRSGRSDWVLGHPTLSRNHCILFDKDGELYLRDNGSLNGTCFNGISASEPVRLQFGDQFTVGRSLLFQVSPVIEKPPKEDTMGAELPTDVFAVDEFPSRQSTVMSKEPTDQK